LGYVARNGLAWLDIFIFHFFVPNEKKKNTLIYCTVKIINFKILKKLFNLIKKTEKSISSLTQLKQNKLDIFYQTCSGSSLIIGRGCPSPNVLGQASFAIEAWPARPIFTASGVPFLKERRVHGSRILMK